MKTYKYKITSRENNLKIREFTDWLNSFGEKGFRIVDIVRKEKSIFLILEKETKPRKEKKSEVNPLIELFNFNPAYTSFYSNTNQRKALEILVKEKGESKVKEMIKKSQEIRGQEFAPKIDTPCQLRDKWLKVEEFQNKSGVSKFY